MIGWVVGWLVGWLAGWLAGNLVVRLSVDQLAGGHVGVCRCFLTKECVLGENFIIFRELVHTKSLFIVVHVVEIQSRFHGAFQFTQLLPLTPIRVVG